MKGYLKIVYYTTIILMVSLSCVSISNDANAEILFSKKYDNRIKKAVKQYWPIGADWRRLKAQYYQESLLNPNAVSHVGAAGIAQFMPKTWIQMCNELKFGNVSAHNANYAIKAGAHYMYKLYKVWRSPRPDSDRWDLATASYNCGTGNMLKAQKASGGKSLYSEIVAFLYQITGTNSKETITYVKNIHKWHGMLLMGN